MYSSHATRDILYSSQPPVGHYGFVWHDSVRAKAPDYWSCSHSMRIGLEPRPFGDLHEERGYLLFHLNSLDELCFDIYHQLVHWEARISQTNGKKRREAKKALQWTKKRIWEHIEKEKALLMRLGDVQIEIQSRERWCAVWCDKINAEEKSLRWGRGLPTTWTRMRQDPSSMVGQHQLTNPSFYPQPYSIRDPKSRLPLLAPSHYHYPELGGGHVQLPNQVYPAGPDTMIHSSSNSGPCDQQAAAPGDQVNYGAYVFPAAAPSVSVSRRK